MATSPHSAEDPFTQFAQLERLVAPGPGITHMVYVSQDVIPGTLQTEAYWQARVARVPELGARGAAWAAAIWEERRQRAELVAAAPGIEPHYYIGVAAISHLVKICSREDALQQVQALCAVTQRPNAHLRLARREVPNGFHGPYEFGEAGSLGNWPQGVWYEELATGATYIDPEVDPDAAREYASIVETLETGLALSEPKSAELLGHTAEVVAAGTWEQWRPEFTSYRFTNVL